MPELSLALLIAASAACYRICRLIILDTIFDRPRDALYLWLADHPRRVSIWLQTLLQCPYCVSVWISGFLTLAMWLLWDLPAPLLYWGAIAAGTLVFWSYIDAED